MIGQERACERVQDPHPVDALRRAVRGRGPALPRQRRPVLAALPRAARMHHRGLCHERPGLGRGALLPRRGQAPHRHQQHRHWAHLCHLPAHVPRGRPHHQPGTSPPARRPWQPPTPCSLTKSIPSPCSIFSFPPQCIRRLGRKWTLCGGLLTLSLSTLGFGLSTSIPLWGVTRVLQGAGSAAAGET